MKAYIPNIFKDKKNKFPSFIKEHKVFKKFPKSIKIFPKLGLKNCEEKVNKNNFLKEFLLQALAGSILEELNYSNTHNKDINYIKNRIKVLIKNKPESFISKSLNLILPEKIESKNKQLSFKKGSDFFKALSDLNEVCYSISIDKHDYTKALIPAIPNVKKMKVVFSSIGDSGLWDIATMSMRGISSCQKWGNSHALALVGTMADPYAGIIYLTNGQKTKYGSKMLRRAVVRFVINKKNKTAILIEQLYPREQVNDKATVLLFKSFLKNKTGGKYEVFYTGGDDEDNLGYSYDIPSSKQVEYLSNGDYIDYDDCYNDYDHDDYLSYRDSGIDYRKNKKYFDAAKACR
jgi:hypothetical protein